jgi:hypothetical protein
MKKKNFKRVWGHEWDYYYLLNLERIKLREMANYTKKRKIILNWERQFKEYELCIKLIDIILEEDSQYKSYILTIYDDNYKKKFVPYINTKNKKRFGYHNDIIFSNDLILNYYLLSIRKSKALYLYNKIRSYRLPTWWV